MIEAQLVIASAFARLKDDYQFNLLIGGRIYRDQVPQAAALPAAIVSLVSSTDMNTLGGDRVWANVLVDVHLVSAGTYGAINGAAHEADVVLQNRGGRFSDPYGVIDVVEFRREQVMAYTENESGVAYAHVISTYRSEAYALPA